MLKTRRVPDGGANEAATGGTATATPEAHAAARRLEAWRCRKKSCCASEIWPVGKDRKGRRLAVVALETHKECLLPQEPMKTASTEAEEENQDRHSCGEYWLVDLGAPKRPPVARLAEQCDGDKWETSASVNPKGMTFGHGGESVYDVNQSSEWTTIGLDPVRLVEVERTWTGRGPDKTERWNFDDFSGQLRRGLFYCPGKVPLDAGVTSTDSNVPDVEIESLRIPRPDLPETFRTEGWKATGLGRCAAQVGGDRGFTIHGAKGTAADASMKILFSSHGDLFIEVTDDRFVTDGKSWVKDDHLEIWLATPPEDLCIDPSTKSPAVQWGIRVADGQVFPGFGAPATTPKVEIARATERTVRLRITFDPNALAGAAFTAVYSDSDDGARQERLIATSQLQFGKWWTLGDVPENEGPGCTIVRGALEPGRPGLPGGHGRQDAIPVIR